MKNKQDYVNKRFSFFKLYSSMEINLLIHKVRRWGVWLKNAVTRVLFIYFFFCANKSKMFNFPKRAPLSRRRGEGGFNWLCKHMKKVRSSQAAILVLNWVKHSFSQWVSSTEVKYFKEIKGLSCIQLKAAAHLEHKWTSMMKLLLVLFSQKTTS